MLPALSLPPGPFSWPFHHSLHMGPHPHPHELWCRLTARPSLSPSCLSLPPILSVQLPPPVFSHQPPTSDFSPQGLSSQPIQSSQLLPTVTPALTCEGTLGLPTGLHLDHRQLTVTPGGQQGKDTHLHCADVETEAQEGEGRHCVSRAPLRPAPQSDILGGGHHRFQRYSDSHGSSHKIQPSQGFHPRLYRQGHLRR